MTELSPLEGTGQVATQELRALIERDAKGAISCDIVKRGEDLDDKLDELCGTVMSLADERCKGAGTGVGQTVSDLTDVCDAPFKKGMVPSPAKRSAIWLSVSWERKEGS